MRAAGSGAAPGINASTATGGLFKCPELAIHMIRAGMAHAMTVTAEPSPEAYLEVQRDAMKNRRGMWAGGVPKYVLTSLHSVDEKPNQNWAYNRLVSTHDGHSERWIHGETYGECDKVCVQEVELDSQVLREAKQRLDSVDELTTWRSLPARKQVEVLEIWLMIETVSAHIPKAERDLMRQSLTQLVETGLLVATKSAQGGCMIYTDYRRRFGGGKASCLKLAMKTSHALIAATLIGCWGCQYELPSRPVLGYEFDDAACSDGVDNDQDQLTDCEDPDCLVGSTHCGEQVPVIPDGKAERGLLCRDQIDNDENGQFDCGDPACRAARELLRAGILG